MLGTEKFGQLLGITPQGWQRVRTDDKAQYTLCFRQDMLEGGVVGDRLKLVYTACGIDQGLPLLWVAYFHWMQALDGSVYRLRETSPETWEVIADGEVWFEVEAPTYKKALAEVEAAVERMLEEE